MSGRDAAVATPVVATFADISTEILVKIFFYVLSTNRNIYNCALPRVCSRWTRIMYRFVYVNGFRGLPYDEELIEQQLSVFADMMAEGDYHPIVRRTDCGPILHRYRIVMHPRVVTYIIMRTSPYCECECTKNAAKLVQDFCNQQWGRIFADVCVHKQDFVIALFVLEYVKCLFASMRVQLQAMLETEFRNSLHVRHLINPNVSVRKRTTVWHDFAEGIREGLRAVHEPIDAHLAVDLCWGGSECTAQKKNRLFNKKCCLKVVNKNIHQCFSRFHIWACLCL